MLSINLFFPIPTFPSTEGCLIQIGSVKVVAIAKSGINVKSIFPILDIGQTIHNPITFVVTMQTPNSNSSTLQDVSRRELRDLVRAQLQSLLEVGDLRGAKAILVPVQPVDIAEAIEGLPEAMHAIAFRLLSKDEAIEVYEYLDYSVQERLIEELRSQEVREIVE